MMWRNVWVNIVEYLYTCTSVTLADNTKVWSNQKKRATVPKLPPKIVWQMLLYWFNNPIFCLMYPFIVHVIIGYVTRLVLLYGSPTPGCCIGDSNQFVLSLNYVVMRSKASLALEVLVFSNCFIKFLNFFIKLDAITFTFKFDTLFLSELLR